MSRSARLAIIALLVASALSVHEARAASILVISGDGPGEGFNDPTPASPVGGNRGTTLGEQRRIAFEYAAELWAARLASPVQIRISANFDPLVCGATSTTLGVAGPVSVFRDFTGAPLPNTFYPSALADQLAGMDLAPEENDIDATFNSVFGTTCPFPASWYYGLDGDAPDEDSDFVTVALHELGHGFGFISFVDVDNGERFQGRDDIFLTFLVDARSNKTLNSMTAAQRRSAIEATGSLRWSGPEVEAASHAALAAGVDALGRVEMFAPPFAQAGSSVSHWSDALSPLQLMEPFFEAPLHDVGLAAPALADVGWSLAPDNICPGDCDADGAVSIDEVVTSVRVALGDAGAALCAAVDLNTDGAVSIDEVVAAVSRALDGCGS